MKKLTSILLFFPFILYAEPKEIGIEITAGTVSENISIHGMCRKSGVEEFTEVGNAPSSDKKVCGKITLDRGETVYCTMDASSGDQRVKGEELVSWTRPADDVYRVNTGGPAYIDTLGRAWMKDGGYGDGCGSVVGKVTKQGSAWENLDIIGTDDDLLYRTNRFNDDTSKTMKYRFPVDNGTFMVNLFFAEKYEEMFFVGRRVMAIMIEGKQVIDELDVFSEVGENKSFVQNITPIMVKDGYIDIEFIAVKGIPMISAIEVIPTIDKPIGLKFTMMP